MIDICFRETFFDTLCQIHREINSREILSLNLYLQYGNISGDIFENQARRNADTIKYMFSSVTEDELQEEYTLELEDFQDTIEGLKRHLSEGQEVRLWIDNSAKDRCALYWFCNFVKEYSNTISVVVCPNYMYGHGSGKAFVINGWWYLNENPNVVIDCAERARILSQYEKQAYENAWNLIVKENAPLRILIDDTVVGVDESFFDSTILKYVGQDPETQESVMGKMLGKWQTGDVSFISKRIEYLIALGKIRVCEEKTDEENCYWGRTISLLKKTAE